MAILGCRVSSVPFVIFFSYRTFGRPRIHSTELFLGFSKKVGKSRKVRGIGFDWFNYIYIVL